MCRFEDDQRNRPSGKAETNRRRLEIGGNRRCWAILTGLAALVWVVFRSGTKPSRLSYPCQQTALATAAGAFGIPLVMLVLTLRKKAATARGAVVALSIAALVVAGSIAGLATASFDDAYAPPDINPRHDYHPPVFVVKDARGIAPGRYGGVDDLVTLMGVSGFDFYEVPSLGLREDSRGLIARDSVVLLKINAQWPENGGTNTDLLRGVIRGIVEHPAGFQGEVIVADNGQGYGNLDRPLHNAEDHGQSTQDVVNDFVREGWRVSARLWDGIRRVSVGEYADGDDTDGYVVKTTYDEQTQVKVSYPKFHTMYGTPVSYKFGIWDATIQQYDSHRLVVINIPVLKTHSIYAVTGAVKNHMGVVTTAQGTDAHYGVGRGGLGSLLAEVRMPDLTILDCIWVLARPGRGPQAPYSETTRTDAILASTDPVALDIWAVKYLLMPEIIANGYPVSSYANTQDPDNPNSVFRRYLDSSAQEILLAGIDVTNDPDAVSLHRWGGDVDRDGDVDGDDIAAYPDCLRGPKTSGGAICGAFDFDDDDDVDLRDAAALQRVYTDSIDWTTF